MALHTFKIRQGQQGSNAPAKFDGRMIADKIGFVVGDLPSVSPINQIGSALFCSRHKLELFEKFGFYETRITEFLDIMKQNMKISHPSSFEENLNQNN